MKKQIKEKCWICENYKASLKYLKECKNFIWVSVGIFVLFCLVGFFVPLPEQFSEMILNFLKELIEKTQGMSQGELISFIFFNNLKSSFLAWVLGIGLGIFPVFVAILNGFVLGFVMKLSVSVSGFGSLWRIFPHGIFELPAIFISLGMGLRLGCFIFEKKKKNSFKEHFYNGLRVFVFVVLPLLIVAGIIEGTLIALG